ncbi:DUF4391 domain-containing protein [Clostridium sp. DL1XJH146]
MMLGLPENYKMKKRFNKKIFIPKDEKPSKKKKIKESIVKAELIYQIQGEEIPSLINESYNVSTIMFLSIEVDNIKNAAFVNGILQEMIKGYVIIKFSDCRGNIVFGYGYKRLSKLDKNEIVLETNFITNIYTEQLFDETNDLIYKYINFEQLKNKINKLAFYSEMMVKSYIITNKKLWSKWRLILDSNVWYNHTNTMLIYALLREVKELKNGQIKVKSTSENIKINKQIMKLYSEMEDLINE